MKLRKFLLVFISFSLLYLSNFNSGLAKKYEDIYLVSFNFQSFINQLKNKIRNSFFSDSDDSYKEKYYQLLKNIAQFKLAKEEEIFNQSLELLKKRFPQAKEVRVFTNDLGIIYAHAVEDVNDKAFVIDNNWLLIGKIIEKTNKYLKIRSLNHSDFQFNVSNSQGYFLGLAKSSGLGYLVVDKVDSKIEIENGDLILTAGNDNIFPAGFLVGEVINIKTSAYFKTIQIAPLANFNSEKLIILQ